MNHSLQVQQLILENDLTGRPVTDSAKLILGKMRVFAFGECGWVGWPVFTIW